jgi:hypothetical protein
MPRHLSVNADHQCLNVEFAALQAFKDALAQAGKESHVQPWNKAAECKKGGQARSCTSEHLRTTKMPSLSELRKQNMANKQQKSMRVIELQRPPPSLPTALRMITVGQGVLVKLQAASGHVVNSHCTPLQHPPIPQQHDEATWPVPADSVSLKAVTSSPKKCMDQFNQNSYTSTPALCMFGAALARMAGQDTLQDNNAPLLQHSGGCNDLAPLRSLDPIGFDYLQGVSSPQQ